MLSSKLLRIGRITEFAASSITSGNRGVETIPPTGHSHRGLTSFLLRRFLCAKNRPKWPNRPSGAHSVPGRLLLRQGSGPVARYGREIGPRCGPIPAANRTQADARWRENQACAPNRASMAQRILIVEDENAIAESVAYSLTREGFEVRTAANGETALGLAQEFDPELMILDLLLPGISGMDVCRLLRQRSSVPIIMLTAKAEEVDRVVGLEVGADDYVAKPFSMRELMARVRAALRRQDMLGRPQERMAFSDARLAVDLDAPSVTVDGNVISLTPRELSLLRVLLLYRGRARTRQQLLDEAWGGDEYIDARTVDVHIRWLRKKLEPDPERPQYIETIRGIGYRFAK